jgi:hypothetical protein
VLSESGVGWKIFLRNSSSSRNFFATRNSHPAQRRGMRGKPALARG